MKKENITENGKAFWIDLNQDLDGHEATKQHKDIYRIIRDVIADNF